jgi:protein involved in polysaccharide export with SLBB domain
MNGLAFDTDQIFALCQSEDDIAQKIAAAYGKYLRSPQITVKIIDRSDRPATTVFGAVKTPHVFRIKRIVKLNELIALSGGIIDTASGEVQILRPARLSCGEDEPVSGKAAAEARYIRVKLADLIAGKPEANPVITTGDIVTVEEAPSIYVIGGVNNPQTILARQEMTVSRAISTAGGALKGADTKKIVIYRRKNGETTTIDVDLSKIEAKQADDVILQALDIIEVPQTGRDSKRPPPEIPVKNRENAQGITGPVVVVD